eukprot:GILI01006402.1.p1 GENE.GILI01006402.1~~GILI01006402.1.p1  ORF type:complete len:293 (-),score=136.06 GILI01006402.1:34-912(-)
MGDAEFINTANDCLTKADKKMKGGFMSAVFGSSSQRYEEAYDLYQKAANNFKRAKQWTDAAEAYNRCVVCQQKLGSIHEAANMMVEAANCLKKVNPSAAVDQFNQAVRLYEENGQFSQAAKLVKQTAELLEGDGMLQPSGEAYEKAAELFNLCNSESTANGCLIKVADINAHLNNYRKAFDMYERVAVPSLDNSLMKFSAKDYFFKAVLCVMATADWVGAEAALARFKDLLPSFSNTREAQLLQSILDANEKGSVDDFTDAVADFNNITQLDSLKTHLLVEIKKLIGKVDLC